MIFKLQRKFNPKKGIIEFFKKRVKSIHILFFKKLRINHFLNFFFYILNLLNSQLIHNNNFNFVIL